MDEFLNDVASWWWWVTTVVFALALNIASSYLKPVVDRRLARVSERRRAAYAAGRERFLEAAKRIAESPHEQVMLGFAIIQNRIRSLVFYVFAALLAVGLSSISELREKPTTWRQRLLSGLALSSVFVVGGMAMTESGQAFRRARLLNEARRMNEGLVMLAPYNRPEGD
jgi:hypothetical protein